MTGRARAIAAAALLSAGLASAADAAPAQRARSDTPLAPIFVSVAALGALAVAGVFVRRLIRSSRSR